LLREAELPQAELFLNKIIRLPQLHHLQV